jgi:hypothetical protein
MIGFSAVREFRVAKWTNSLQYFNQIIVCLCRTQVFWEEVVKNTRYDFVKLLKSIEVGTAENKD